MPKFIASPTAIACVGNITKFANEYVGLVNNGDPKLSISRVQSPPGWAGTGQYADYHEYRIVIGGLLHVDHADGAFDVEAGQGLDIRPGEWVRFSTPGPAGADYVTVCTPALSARALHRDK